jgi:hypothetical protein
MLPDRLDCLVDFATVLRLAKRIDEAILLFRNSVFEISSMTDYRESVRGFWYEWGVCEGSSGQAAGADTCLQSISLSDHLEAAQFNTHRIAVSCAGLGKSFAHDNREKAYVKARAAAAYIGLLAEPDVSTKTYLETHAIEAKRKGIGKPDSLFDAIDWLKDGTISAYELLRDPFIKKLVVASDFEFRGLLEFLSRRRGIG